MFSKFSKKSEFDGILTEGMKEYLADEHGETINLTKQAAVKEAQDESKKVFAFVAEELVKCAEALEDLGHPLHKEVDKVLSILETELQTLGKKEDQPNPWAICTASVGRDDPEKFERCVLEVKKQHGIKASLTEGDFVKHAK